MMAGDPDEPDDDPVPEEWYPDDDLFVLTAEDIEDRLADAYVDLREEIGDTDAMFAVDVMRERLTDRWYHENRNRD